MALHYLPVWLIRLFKVVLLILPFLAIWSFFFILVSSVARDSALEKEKESLEVFHTELEKTTVCERLRLPDFPEAANATVLEFCRQWELDQRLYFSRRPHKINAFNHSIVKSADAACDSDTFMAVLVHSLHSYKERRDAIRRTWGGAVTNGTWPGDTLGGLKVRMIFIFGQHPDPGLEMSLKEESRTRGDVVQGDFVESYKNMTLKSLLGLKWVVERCPSVRYIFKCDDDMFVNVPAILRILRVTKMAWSIMGPLNVGSKVYRRTGKWALTKDQYPFYYFPPYESGSGYAISADLVRPLLEASDYVPWIFVDDVYVTGILGKILAVSHVHRSGFAYWTSKAPKVCDIRNDSILTGTKVFPNVQLEIWKQLTEGVHCPVNSTAKTNSTSSNE